MDQVSASFFHRTTSVWANSKASRQWRVLAFSPLHKRRNNAVSVVSPPISATSIIDSPARMVGLFCGFQPRSTSEAVTASAISSVACDSWPGQIPRVKTWRKFRTGSKRELDFQYRRKAMETPRMIRPDQSSSSAVPLPGLEPTPLPADLELQGGTAGKSEGGFSSFALNGFSDDIPPPPGATLVLSANRLSSPDPETLVGLPEPLSDHPRYA